ncbi:MAG: cold-shock protein [Promethearchaeota archaeon]
MSMVKGTVKWFNSKKGYGFITPEDESGDIFVHYTAIQAEGGAFKVIYEGDIVEFEITQGKKGPQASDVVVVEEGPRTNIRGRKSFY